MNKFVEFVAESVVFRAAAFMLASISMAGAQSAPPLEGGAIGTLAPAQFYVVDIATDPQGNVHVIDPRYKTLSRYSADGTLQIEITDPRFRWLRGLTVDSLGRMYVLDPTWGTIRIYQPDGTFVDEWFGFSGAESMDVDEFDNVYVAMGGAIEGSAEVVKFDSAGNELLRFGSPGSGPGQFNRPHDVAVAPDGAMWVTETGNSRVQKFDASGNYLLTIGTGQRGSGQGEFSSPVSVSVDSAGNLYVSDRRNFRVQKFDADGNYLLEWGSKGAGPGQFLEFHGLTVGPDDTVWVAGYHGHDVQHFDGSGALLARWQDYVSGPGDFSDARGTALVDGVLFVVDGWNQRVQAFDESTGEYLYEFGERGQGDATVFNFPRAMASGPNGDLYISDDDNVRRIQTDGTFVRSYARPTGPRPGSQGLAVSDQGVLFMSSRGNNEIVKYDINTGAILDRWGVLGSGPGQFNKPNGVAIGPNGNVYVADTHNHRVQVLTQAGTFIDEWTGFSGPLGITVDPARQIAYVGDAWADRVIALDLNGNELYRWGQTGTGLGEFENIYDIEVSDSGTVYVSEYDNGRVQKFVYPYTGEKLGRPVAYQPGADLGYFIWQDKDDSEWHVRWSGDGPAHQFDLTVTSINGRLAGVAPFSFEAVGDSIIVQPESIEISSIAGSWEDGVDFFASPGSIIRFDLKIDGVSRDDLVFVGALSNNPGTLPLYIAAQVVPQPENFLVFGQPAYQPGVDLGYFLWQEPGDGEWHLRWNSNQVPRLFTGSILSTGSITSASPFSFEAADQMSLDDFVLNFSGWAGNWHDGLDFRIPPGEEFILRLAFDGVAQPAAVKIGASSESPITPTFALVSQPTVSPIDPVGKPAYVDGQDLGYFIWTDGDGTWHLIANPDGVVHEFSGSLTTTAPITNYSGVSIEASDIVNVAGQQIDWNLTAGSWYDGFDFVVPPGTYITFTIAIDGSPAAILTFVGAGNAQPAQAPFLLVD